MSITYASRDPSFAYTVEDSVGFQCEYTVDDSFWTTWDNVFITAMVFSGAYWAYGMMRVSRRRITRDADSSLMMYAVGTGAACVAGGLAVVLIFGGLYWFLFFKAQQEVYVVVPMDSDSRVKMFKEVLDAAVGDHGDRERRLHLGDRRPVAEARALLLARAAVHREHRAPRLLQRERERDRLVDVAGQQPDLCGHRHGEAAGERAH